MKIRFMSVAALLLAAPLSAQEMRTREAPPGSAPETEAHLVLPTVAPDPARPFVGVWQGEFHGPRGGTAPMAVVIEFLNGQYVGSQATGPMMVRLHEHRTDVVAGDSLVWTQPNNGGGTLVFTARRGRDNTLTGTMTLHDGPPELMNGPAATFTLRRVTGH